MKSLVIHPSTTTHSQLSDEELEDAATAASKNEIVGGKLESEDKFDATVRAEAAEKLKQKQEEMSNALGKAAGNVEAKYRSLQQQWGRLKTESEKNKWIKE